MFNCRNGNSKGDGGCVPQRFSRRGKTFAEVRIVPFRWLSEPIWQHWPSMSPGMKLIWKSQQGHCPPKPQQGHWTHLEPRRQVGVVLVVKNPPNPQHCGDQPWPRWQRHTLDPHGRGKGYCCSQVSHYLLFKEKILDKTICSEMMASQRLFLFSKFKYFFSELILSLVAVCLISTTSSASWTTRRSWWLFE